MEETREQILKEYHQHIGTLGGTETFRRYGVEHYKKMSQKGVTKSARMRRTGRLKRALTIEKSK